MSPLDMGQDPARRMRPKLLWLSLAGCVCGWALAAFVGTLTSLAVVQDLTSVLLLAYIGLRVVCALTATRTDAASGEQA